MVDLVRRAPSRSLVRWSPLAGLRQWASAGLERYRSSRKAVTAWGDTGWTSMGGALGRLLPGTQTDWRERAGDLWDNSIVLACIKWQARVFPEAPIVVEARGPGGKWEPMQRHPLPDMLAMPTPWYSGTVLWQATLLSLAVDGNAYWYKLRSAAGKLVGWQYIPHFLIGPYHAKGDPNLLTGYRLISHGATRLLLPEDVVHFRDGLDPHMELRGLSPLGATLREVCTDNEAATFSVSILSRMGIPGAVISPKNADRGGLTALQVTTFKRLWQEAFTGDNRGDVFVNGIPVDVINPAFSPEQMVLEKTRNIPEERITSALGIPAVVVGLGAGLAAAGDRNLEAMERWAWQHNIVPTQRVLTEQLTRDFRAEGILRPGQRIAFDLSNVTALQEDRDRLAARVTSLFQGGVITRNEARMQLGLPPAHEADTGPGEEREGEPDDEDVAPDEDDTEP